MIRIQALPHVHQLDGYTIVELPMTAHDRRRVRRRIETPDGFELALELPTGAALYPGQVLHIEQSTAYQVSAAPEEVLLVRPRNWREAAEVGHLIGNLHRDVDISDEGILALWDPPLEERLRKAGLDAERTTRPFRGKAPGEHEHSH